MPRRIACLLVRDFPLAARIRREPQLTAAPVAMVEADGTTPAVIAVSGRARRQGVRPGLSLPQARVLYPDLIARPRDRSIEQSAQETLLEAALTLSPLVENSSPGCIYLDLGGMGSEKAVAERAVAAAEAAGFLAQVGIAEGRIAARLAAGRAREKWTILPEGEDAAYLAPLPLAWLKPPSPLLERLSRWGVRTAGELASLPPGEVARRLGAAGLALHRDARGEDGRPLSAWRSAVVFSERVDLDWALCEIEAFCAVARPMLDRLCAHLSTFAVACRRLDVVLALEPKGEERRSLPLAAPTTEVKTLLERIALELAAHPPAAPIVGITLHAHPERPRQAQLSLFGPASHSPDALATAVARLSLLLGADRIGSPRTVNGVRPERFTIEEYAPPPPPRTAPALERPSLTAAIRVLRPMIAIQVETRGSPGRPLFIEKEKGTDRFLFPSGKVRTAAGPWRLEEGWWTEEAIARDYWDVELPVGVWRIFNDRREERWFADGLYD